jgi:hypothetical protein
MVWVLYRMTDDWTQGAARRPTVVGGPVQPRQLQVPLAA